MILGIARIVNTVAFNTTINVNNSISLISMVSRDDFPQTLSRIQCFGFLALLCFFPVHWDLFWRRLGRKTNSFERKRAVEAGATAPILRGKC